MERLTKDNGKAFEPFRYSLEDISTYKIYDLFYEITFKVLQKLGKYEDAEEQGLLLKLPCKVGDKVYQISENFIEPCTVETIFLGKYRDRNGNWCNMAEIYYDRDDCPYVSTEIYFTDIGETVFLTETEAEAKLKEMEENDGK